MIFSFVFLIMLLAYISSSLESKKRYDENIDYEIKARRNRFNDFSREHCASRLMVEEALKSEKDNTDDALSVKNRLRDEAGIDIDAYKDGRIYLSMSHLVALGIMAQNGKIPPTFMASGISLSKDCYIPGKMNDKKLILENERMLKSFLKWYDNELFVNGICEHFVYIPPKTYFNKVSDRDYLNVTKPIDAIDSVSNYGVIFLPTSMPCAQIGSSLCSFEYVPVFLWGELGDMW